MILRLNSQNPPAPPSCRGRRACGLPDSFVILLQGVCRGCVILYNSGKLFSEGAALCGPCGLGQTKVVRVGGVRSHGIRGLAGYRVTGTHRSVCTLTRAAPHPLQFSWMAG